MNSSELKKNFFPVVQLTSDLPRMKFYMKKIENLDFHLSELMDF